MDIGKVKKHEMDDIRDFVSGIEEYGHIFLLPVERLDEPFRKILEGIEEIQQMMKDSFEM